jgi:hypothetical protein
MKKLRLAVSKSKPRVASFARLFEIEESSGDSSLVGRGNLDYFTVQRRQG